MYCIIWHHFRGRSHIEILNDESCTLTYCRRSVGRVYSLGVQHGFGFRYEVGEDEPTEGNTLTLYVARSYIWLSCIATAFVACLLVCLHIVMDGTGIIKGKERDRKGCSYINLFAY